MYAAITLRKQLDMLLARESEFKVIIMGDFNDEPTNNSLARGLSASNKRKNIGMGEYYNLFYDLHNVGNQGTYNYQGNWNMLDQVTGYEGGKIHQQEDMMFQSEKYGILLPSATYGGPQYYGGPSDHLPVYVEFTW